jgi:hypothetical protein
VVWVGKGSGEFIHIGDVSIDANYMPKLNTIERVKHSKVWIFRATLGEGIYSRYLMHGTTVGEYFKR